MVGWESVRTVYKKTMVLKLDTNWNKYMNYVKIFVNSSHNNTRFQSSLCWKWPHSPTTQTLVLLRIHPTVTSYVSFYFLLIHASIIFWPREPFRCTGGSINFISRKPYLQIGLRSGDLAGQTTAPPRPSKFG